MLRTALRILALVVLLALAPEMARADNECGPASGGTESCSFSGGALNDGVRYFVSNANGLTLTVQERTVGRARAEGRIEARELVLNDELSGHGIGIFGSYGDGAGLHLVVNGDTNIGGDDVFSNDGIRIRNGRGSSSRRVTGSVTVNLGAAVDIGTDDNPFDDHGINTIIEAGPSGTTTSNAGISITNAGTIHADERGIRASGFGFKVRSPAANHLNGRIEVTHSGSIHAGMAGIHAVSERNADVAIMLQAGGTIMSNDEGILALTKGAAGPGGAGDVTVTSAGTITARNGAGIRARVDSGTGSLRVEVNGGTVTATGGTGIHTTSGNDGGQATITIAEDRSVTGGTHGIFAEHSGTGSAGVTVNVAGTVTGGSDENDAAIKLSAGGPSAITLTDGFRINGDILFDGADENDSLVLAVAEDRRGEVAGDIQGLTMLTKNGAGAAYLGGAASLAGSAATPPTFEISEGVLILRGHVDLGDTGTFTVKDGSQLTVEVGPEDGDHGSVTAGTMVFEATNPEVHVALVRDPAQREAAAQQVRDGIRVFRGGAAAGAANARVVLGGFDLTGTTVGKGGVIRARPNSGGGGSGGGSGGTALLVVGGGALAYLLWDMGLFDEATPLGSDGSGWQSGTLTRSLSSTPSGIPSSDKGIEYRVRVPEPVAPAFAAILPASGVATSLRAHLGDGFHADLTGTPSLSAGFGRDSVSGSRHGLGLGWRSGRFSTDIGYSRATLTTRSTFSNVAGLGMLEGTHGQRHDQLRANARLRIETAGLSLAPSLSLYGGTVSGESYTASSSVWLSEIPSVTQDYSGWKAGLTVTPGSGMEAIGLRWHPELRLTTARLADGGGEDLEIVQKDRTGALQLQSRARATLPRAVHALGGGLTVADGEDWSLRGGYVAMLADGDLEQAAIAGFRLRF